MRRPNNNKFVGNKAQRSGWLACIKNKCHENYKFQ